MESAATLKVPQNIEMIPKMNVEGHRRPSGWWMAFFAEFVGR